MPLLRSGGGRRSANTPAVKHKVAKGTFVVRTFRTHAWMSSNEPTPARPTGVFDADDRTPIRGAARWRIDPQTLAALHAKEAYGHGVRGKRSKSGAISFDLMVVQGGHAQL